MHSCPQDDEQRPCDQHNDQLHQVMLQNQNSREFSWDDLPRFGNVKVSSGVQKGLEIGKNIKDYLLRQIWEKVSKKLKENPLIKKLC